MIFYCCRRHISSIVNSSKNYGKRKEAEFGPREKELEFFIHFSRAKIVIISLLPAFNRSKHSRNTAKIAQPASSVI
jgi:hypothetical protein